MPEVLIVGAGPTGLLLAGDLAAAGIDVTVLERRDTESNLTRAFAVHARTLELLDARGLADELIATGRPVTSLRLFDRIRIDLSRLDSRYPFVLITPQYHTERILADRAAALGVKVVRGATVTGLRQDADGVDVDVRTTDGATETRRARYVVGADGHRSAVRTALGLPFPGGASISSVMLADVRLSEPPPETLSVNSTGDELAFLVPFGDGWFRVIAWDRRHQVPDSEPVDVAELRALLRRTLGTDFGMGEPRWTGRFHSDERQVPDYRLGRVFLAGDAAHVHSPAGGQGMNTGLQDAANLGWKLAAVVRGRRPAALLDSYNAERHPVGAMVLRSSGGLIRAAQLRSRPARAVRAAIAGTLVRLGPVMRRATGQLSGLSIAYRAPRGAHRLAGRRAPDVALADGLRLYEALRAGHFVLLGTALDADPEREQVDFAVPAAGGRSLILVRPDGYVAWASDEPDPARRASALAGALADWI